MSNSQTSIAENNREFFWGKVGSFCRRCNYNECIPALQLHHLEKSKKGGKLDTFGAWLFMPRMKFLDKIINTKFTILCANCHARLHFLERSGLSEAMTPVDTSIFSDEVFASYQRKKFLKNNKAA